MMCVEDLESLQEIRFCLSSFYCLNPSFTLFVSFLSRLNVETVFDAGHMVPADQPDVALEMITNFMNGGAF